MKRKKDNENSAFHLFSEMFAHGRDDSKIESIVLELYGKAMSYPWPEKVAQFDYGHI